MTLVLFQTVVACRLLCLAQPRSESLPDSSSLLSIQTVLPSDLNQGFLYDRALRESECGVIVWKSPSRARIGRVIGLTIFSEDATMRAASSCKLKMVGKKQRALVGVREFIDSPEKNYFGFGLDCKFVPILFVAWTEAEIALGSVDFIVQPGANASKRLDINYHCLTAKIQWKLSTLLADIDYCVGNSWQKIWISVFRLMLN